MSYLSRPRLCFSGRFQADVSTVNNDVRHYANATFEARFQDPIERTQDRPILNGWWNPEGSGAFRLIDVQVTRAYGEVEQSDDDAALGLYLNSQVQRTSAKLVDLDPQFQLGSMIFGLRVVLTDGEAEFMRADYRPAAFRDLVFGREDPAQFGGRSAKFTSVLTNIEWTEAAAGSPVLSALRAASEASGRLSVNLATFGYSTRSTFGRVTGSIGVCAADAPNAFVLGRRFGVAKPFPSTPRENDFVNEQGFGFFDALVDGDRLTLDLANAMPLANADGIAKDLDDIQAAILLRPDTVTGLDTGTGSVTMGIGEGDTVDATDLKLLGALPYRAPGWMLEEAGLVEIALDDEAKGLVSDHPLALVQPANSRFKVLIRETAGGLFVRADDFEHRIDTVKTGPVSNETVFHVAKFGRPLSGVLVGFHLREPESGQGDDGGRGLNPPTAPVPDIGTPAAHVRFPASAISDPNGVVRLEIDAYDPLDESGTGPARGYIDGQIYKIDYNFPLTDAPRPPAIESVVLHLRDAFEAPSVPDWETDIAPIMIQYGNLYPIMSKGLFSFSDREVVEREATLLAFAFTRPLEDPNHMPVTRDLSFGKREATLRWLAQFVPATEMPASMIAGPSPGNARYAVNDTAPLPPIMSAEMAEDVIAALDNDFTDKAPAVRSALIAARRRTVA